MFAHHKALVGVLCAIGLFGAGCSTTSSTTTLVDSPITADTTTATDTDSDAILNEASSGGIAFGDDLVLPFSDIGFESDLEIAEGLVIPAALIGVYADGDAYVIVPADLAEQGPRGDLFILTPDGDIWVGEDLDFAEFEGGFTASGSVTSSATDQRRTFDLNLPFGAGNTTFDLDSNRAIVRGVLGSHTFDQVTYLIGAHPEIDTLVLQDVPGSVNDEVNMETGRLVREAGYTTIVPSDGEAASGGVDLFTAGVVRIVEPGGRLGIHSWCCGPNGETAAELDRDDPAHDAQLAYFTEMLGPDTGPEFYFATLQAAPFDDVHYMTAAEIARYQLTTD
jgi:hypothetical protein